MKIAILGYGKEGKSAEKYFQSKSNDITIFDQLTPTEFAELDLTPYELILRSPSVPPSKQQKTSSVTKYFFDHCPAPIIGVTGTKGKGTTCSMIKAIFEQLGHKVWLVGNIGTPALDVLDDIQSTDVVIYEMSSFQLWDLEKSPHIAVVLPIETDHLNIHKDFDDYVDAKSHITKYQTRNDYCIYYKYNNESEKIAMLSNGQKISYPDQQSSTSLQEVLDALIIPGNHNRENAEAALLATAAWHNQTLATFLTQNQTSIIQALHNFHGLPHRLEFVRELNNVKYYDDNFSTMLTSTITALNAFPDTQIILIAGGRDKTKGKDLPKLADHLRRQTFQSILIGESGRELAKLLPNDTYVYANTLTEAVHEAQRLAESTSSKKSTKPIIVLMSPAAASFDMFENVYDRGTQYQDLVRKLT